jgi:hypothetical protein
VMISFRHSNRLHVEQEKRASGPQGRNSEGDCETNGYNKSGFNYICIYIYMCNINIYYIIIYACIYNIYIYVGIVSPEMMSF